MTDLTPRGPFETTDEVLAAAQPLRDAVRAVDPDDRFYEQTRARWIDARAHYIISTLTGCGVELGTQDERTVRWMAATLDQPETAVLLDFVKRARAAALGVHQAEAELKHALPPIDFPGRLAGIGPGPRCGAEGITVLFAADVTCPACLADIARAEAPGLQWVLYRPSAANPQILVTAGESGERPGETDPCKLALEILTEFADADHVVKVYGPDERLAAWSQFEDGEAVAYLNKTRRTAR